MTCFADVVRPSTKPLAFIFDCSCVVAGSLLLFLMANCSIPLWFTPVPLSMHTFAILMISALLGKNKGTLTVIFYIAAASMGGFCHFFGPTGGYYVGFILCTYTVGFLLERGWKEKYGLTLCALLIGSALILSAGALWLGMFVGYANVLALGVYPFIIGDLVKLLLAAALIPSGWKGIQYVNMRLFR